MPIVYLTFIAGLSEQPFRLGRNAEAATLARIVPGGQPGTHPDAARYLSPRRGLEVGHVQFGRGRVVGGTQVGRATVQVLAMTAEESLRLRTALQRADRYFGINWAEGKGKSRPRAFWRSRDKRDLYLQQTIRGFSRLRQSRRVLPAAKIDVSPSPNMRHRMQSIDG